MPTTLVKTTMAEPTTLQQALPLYHTLSVCFSVVTSTGTSAWAILKALDRYATNHFQHMKADVIAEGKENTKDIVSAINTSTNAIVAATQASTIAILQAKS